MTYPYNCRAIGKTPKRVQRGHWPKRTTHTDPKPKHATCQYCGDHIVLHKIRPNVERYATSILITEWP